MRGCSNGPMTRELRDVEAPLIGGSSSPVACQLVCQPHCSQKLMPTESARCVATTPAYPAHTLLFTAYCFYYLLLLLGGIGSRWCWLLTQILDDAILEKWR
jgi:hypothetical protein